MGHAPRPCPHCRAVFAPGHGNQRFCSNDCLVEFHKARKRKGPVALECSWCGSSFESLRRTQKTCSAECRRLSFNAYQLARLKAAYVPVVKPCVRCGADFSPGQGRAVTCPSCKAEPPAPRLVIVRWAGCALCGEGFSRAEELDQRFCSRACANGSRAKPPRICTQCGAEWRPSRRPEARAASRCWECRRPKGEPNVYANIKGSLRRRLILREGGQCQDCGCTAEDIGESLHAHHVEPQALGGSNALENLRLLCPDCHVGSGWWRNHWQLAASGLVVPPVHAQAA